MLSQYTCGSMYNNCTCTYTCTLCIPIRLGNTNSQFSFRCGPTETYSTTMIILLVTSRYPSVRVLHITPCVGIWPTTSYPPNTILCIAILHIIILLIFFLGSILAAEVRGIPEFWLTALRNAELFEAIIKVMCID